MLVICQMFHLRIIGDLYRINFLKIIIILLRDALSALLWESLDLLKSL